MKCVQRYTNLPVFALLRSLPISAGGLSLLLDFQKEGLAAGSQFLVGVAGKERGDFFRGVPVFT